MATEVLLPQWGMEMAEGTIVKWFKNEGDTIQEGEPLVAIETAKLETDLESVASGVVSHIMVPEGATVPIRTVLAVIGEPGEEVARPSGLASSPTAARVAAGAPPSSAAQPASDGIRVQVVPAARRLAQENDIDLAQIQGSGPRGRVLIADVERAIETAVQPAMSIASDAPRVQVVPAARRLAQQNGIDLATVEGSGPNGRVLIADVERAIASPAAAGPEPVQLAGMRRTIATRMLQSAQTSAQVTLMSESNITEAMTLRNGLARQWSEHGLSPLALVIKAVARALKDHPQDQLGAGRGQLPGNAKHRHRRGRVAGRRADHAGVARRGRQGAGADSCRISRVGVESTGRKGHDPRRSPAERSRSPTWGRMTWTALRPSSTRPRWQY